MKRDPKVLIAAIPFMLMMFSLYTTLNKRADEEFRRKTSMEPPEPAAVSAPYHVDKGDSETLSCNADIRGTVTYSVDIDSSEGYIYLYDKNGRIKDSVHYTRNDMPVSRSADVKKGECTLEVTRSPASNGTGDMYADMKFAPDNGAVQDLIIIGVFVATLIGIILVLVSPKRKVGYRQDNTELILDGDEVKNEFETPLDSILKAFDTKRP